MEKKMYKNLILHSLSIILILSGNLAWADTAEPNSSEIQKRQSVTTSINVDEAKNTGSLTKDQVAKVIAEYMGQIEYCYERQLQKEPTLRGEIRVHFVIDKLGKVATASTMNSTMKS
jgi:outer membrane biosynthesis protein TonB